ncbi:MAG TPA: hypothetical protein VH475_10970 [Tepidisphaeraceae bacterium]
MEVLDRCAAEAGVRPLSEFFSESPEESFESIGEDVPEGMEGSDVQWFAAEEGLASIRGLAQYVSAHPGVLNPPKSSEAQKPKKTAGEMLADLEALAAKITNARPGDPLPQLPGSGRLPSAQAVVTDLNALAGVLEVARKHGTRFRLRIDF